MAAPEKKSTPAKRPTALKRNIQSQKRQLRNRIFKSRVSTAMRQLREQIAAAGSKPETLSQVYSLLDKGVKKGIIKQNKAGRLKSRLTTKATAKA